MAATTEDMRQSIDVGSMPFGDRQAFESSLGDVGGGAGGPMLPGARQTQDDSGLGIPSNPLDPMLAGELDTGSDPLTSGLSMGPGPGPVMSGVAPISDSGAERLRILALNAASPVLRQMARNALRGTVREYRSG